MTTTSGRTSAAGRLAKTGAVLVRAGAVSLALVTVVLGAVAAADPGSVGLTRGRILTLATLAVAIHVSVALLPWERLWHTRAGVAGRVTYLTTVLLLVVTAAALSDPPASVLLWLALLVVMFSGTVLPTTVHAATTILTLAALLGVLAVGGSPFAAVDLLAFTLVYALAAAFAALATAVGRRSLEETAALHERSRRFGDLVTEVAEAGRDLSTVDVDAIFETIVRTSAHLGADMVGLYVQTDEGLLAYSASHGLPEALAEERFHRPEGLVGEVLATRRTIVVPDYLAYPDAMPEYVEAGLRSALGIPILTAAGIAGLLVLGSLTRRDYDPTEVRALELLAAYAGRAIELADRYDEQEEAIGRLRELDRLKQDFLATVSHELRTPLTVIGGLSETLDRRWGAMPEETRRELLRRIRANAGSLDGIIAKLLDFVRLERGELATRLEPFDGTALVRATADRLETLVRPQRALEVRVDDDVTVRGDERLIERVLENLLVNAARHTPEGATVTVELVRGRGSARFCVRDDGPGISAVDLDRIGERFYRGGDPNERPTGGLGLGLALSGEILRRHGSDLEVASEPGSGSRFAFELPLVRAAAGEQTLGRGDVAH